MIFENWFRLMHGIEIYSTVHSSSPWSVDIGLYDTDGNSLEPCLTPYYSVSGFNGGTNRMILETREASYTYPSICVPALFTGNDTYVGTENSLLNEITSNFKLVNVYKTNIIENGQHKIIQSVTYINNTNTDQEITKVGWYQMSTRNDASSAKKVTAFITDLDNTVIVKPNEQFLYMYNTRPTHNQPSSKIFENYNRMQYLIRGFGMCVESRSTRTEDFEIYDTSGNKVTPYIYVSENRTEQNNTLNTLYRGDQNYKIILGTGDNTYDGTEYCLANDISSNFTNLAYNANLTFDTDGLYREYTVTGTNSSGSDQVITELGFVKKVPYNTSGATNDVLYAVTKLDSPVTVPNGSSFTGTFNWDWTN